MSPIQPEGIDPGLVDFAVLDRWMSGRGLSGGEISGVQLLSGGSQNVLIRFQRGDAEYVLRRPPKHLRPSSNDNLRREARVLGALTGSGVAAPALIAACDDETVMGDAAFFLMQSVDGFNPTSQLPRLHADDAGVRHAMGLHAAEELARLGAVDHVAAGLADFGKPEGFLERQVPRWTAELESYTRHDGYHGPGLPGRDDIASWLERHVPATFRPGIMHGDYHLANLLYRPDGPQVAAIVDWEMCTIGDPLLDLGWLLATWPGEDTAGKTIGTMVGALGAAGGLPTGPELIACYGTHSARDLSTMRWYGVLACFKLGIVLEGTYARSCAGKADRGLGELFHTITCALFERAKTFIEETW
jgi:aminoglycoside phosphotransferase (APT) family kinase protein